VFSAAGVVCRFSDMVDRSCLKIHVSAIEYAMNLWEDNK